MKTRTFCLAVMIGLAGAAPMRSAEAGTSFAFGISISHVRDFYEPLGAYGTWVEMADYGRCWRPAYIGTDWQPYANGHWEWTDQGWYWVSDEPWAWAAYHYGRWVWDPYYGWLWVPGTVWAPAWVAWREGGGHCGWAPMPPARFCGTGGLVFWDRIGWHSRAFVFVQFGRFCEPVHYRHHHHHGTVVNQTIINQTVNVTNIRVGDVERHVGRPLPPSRAADLWRERSERTWQQASLDRAAPPPRAELLPPTDHRRHESSVRQPEPRRETVVRPPEPRTETVTRSQPEPRRETFVRPPEPRQQTVVRPTEPVRSGPAEPARPQPTREQRSFSPMPRQEAFVPQRQELRPAPQPAEQARPQPTREQRSFSPMPRQEAFVPQRQELRPAPQPAERPAYQPNSDSRGSDRRGSDGNQGRDRYVFGRR